MAQSGRPLTRRYWLWVCVLSVGASAQWVVGEDNCSTPDRSIGSCIPVKQCKPMTNFLATIQRPLSQEVITFLKSYTCGYTSSSIKVCCPSTPLKVPDDNVMENPSPPDVSNHKNLNLLPEKCGVFVGGDIIIATRGYNASLNEFPWMALLSYNTRTGPQFRCTGTIINDRWILTAAHCITNLNNQPLLGVRVGEYNILTEIDCDPLYESRICNTNPIQDVAIEEIHAHPQYNATARSLINDIGLLKVAKINLNAENIQPVCLPVDGKVRNMEFRGAVVTGWGTTASGQKSNILQIERVSVVDLKKCQDAYKIKSEVQVTYKQICAAGDDRSYSCVEEGGGPLVIRFVNDDVRYVQQGIVSFGPRFCGLKEYPVVYTKIAFYMDWILDTIHQ